MSRCETCRFWSRAGEGWRVSHGDETNDWKDIRSQHRLCAQVIHANAGDYDRSTIETALAIVTDGSGYAAALRTLPTFGCVLWEAEPAEEG